MLADGIMAQPQISARHQTADVDVALVARKDVREHIAQILRRRSLKFSTFATAEALLRRSRRRATYAIVLWVDANTDLGANVEPLTRSLPQAPLVVVGPRIERRDARAALAGGAAGIVLSQNMESTLGPCIEAVIAGQTCVPRDQWRQIDPPALSSREKQILGLVVMGYMNGQIAEQLFLAESTIKSHLSSAFGKLGVRSRNEAVNLILDPERGLGMGILALVGEGGPHEPRSPAAQ
jgi:DNA-binding NarL/FixJ family response regulator